MRKLFLIFGNPVSHSKSPLMHNYFFKKEKIDALHLPIYLASVLLASRQLCLTLVSELHQVLVDKVTNIKIMDIEAQGSLCKSPGSYPFYFFLFL
jgi:hypothetical protein